MNEAYDVYGGKCFSVPPVKLYEIWLSVALVWPLSVASQITDHSSSQSSTASTICILL